MSLHMEKQTVLAIRDECLEISMQAMRLFDELEDGELTEDGARAAVIMASRSRTVHETMTLIARADLMGMLHR